jgi:hypothetical protein
MLRAPIGAATSELLAELVQVYRDVHAAADAQTLRALQDAKNGPSIGLLSTFGTAFTAGAVEGREAWKRENARLLLDLEPDDLERILHRRGPNEGSAMYVDRQGHSGIGADLRTVGIAAVPGTVLIAAISAFNLRFVSSGWPLFTILWLALLSGGIAALGRRR